MEHEHTYVGDPAQFPCPLHEISPGQVVIVANGWPQSPRLPMSPAPSELPKFSAQSHTPLLPLSQVPRPEHVALSRVPVSTSLMTSDGGVMDGETLYTSGKSGTGATLEAQMRDSLESIRNILRLAGMEMGHVVEAHVYLKDTPLLG